MSDVTSIFFHELVMSLYSNRNTMTQMCNGSVFLKILTSTDWTNRPIKTFGNPLQKNNFHFSKLYFLYWVQLKLQGMEERYYLWNSRLIKTPSSALLPSSAIKSFDYLTQLHTIFCNGGFFQIIVLFLGINVFFKISFFYSDCPNILIFYYYYYYY